MYSLAYVVKENAERRMKARAVWSRQRDETIQRINYRSENGLSADPRLVLHPFVY